ncbi:hypothetical protein S7711_09826 [Stachybotrys chartarum IBT 7711]|uniref:Uncharacterized protein n=1 Tax=Stachybotrys chartarum (strain CBS 109288 / IBT 7711) TaxID=1280523 RepID=A0A084AU51_STACB|nr:hypothetical protein S7711_09826 [Stachybotrys chartarum IBT 7711]
MRTAYSPYLRRWHRSQTTSAPTTIPPDKRRKITSLIRRLNPALRDPKTASPRPDGSLRDNKLRQAQGFACKFCNVPTTSKQIISRHVGDQHLADKARIGVKSPAMYQTVNFQSWIRNPTNGCYWIAKDDACLDDGTRPVGDQYVFEHLRPVVDRERQRQWLHQQRRQGILVKDRVYSEIRQWLERTGWERTYSSVDRRLLRSLITMPRRALDRLCRRRPLHITTANRAEGYAPGKDALASSVDDEEKLTALSLATERIMVRRERSAKTSGRNTLCWLRSVQPLTPFPKPFALVGKEKGRKRYIKVLQRFVALAFRACRLPPQHRQSVTGLSFSLEQVHTMGKIWNHRVWEQDGPLGPRFWKRVENDQERGVSRPPEGSPYRSQAWSDLSEAYHLDEHEDEDEGESEDGDTDGSDYDTNDKEYINGPASNETSAISSNTNREAYEDDGDHAVSIQAGRELL